MSKTPINRFIDYFSKPLTSEQISYLNNINNISFERVEVFHDFIITLLHVVNDTYLGDDVITNSDERLSHFNWCWNKVISNFQKESIRIETKGEHFQYFFTYFNDIFYYETNKESNMIEKYIIFWNDIMKPMDSKTKSEYDLFVDIYKVMGKYFFK